METKKAPSVDLEKRRFRHFLFGVFLAGGLLLLVLNLRIGGGEASVDSDLFEDIMQDLQSLPEEDRRDEVPLFEEPKPIAGERLVEVDRLETAAEELSDDNSSLFETEVDDLADAAADDETEEPIVVDEHDKVLSWRIVEELPEFPGGLREYMKWLTAEIKYPKEARRRSIEGTVVVTFIVNEDGSISDIKAQEPSNVYLREEALRVIRSMPAWKAGTYKDRPCRTLIETPIIFKI